MNIHVSMVHKQEKPFKCEVCNHCFSRKSSLLNHVASIHEQKNHFKCEFCDKKFLKNVTWMYMLLWVISRKAFQMWTLWPNFFLNAIFDESCSSCLVMHPSAAWAAQALRSSGGSRGAEPPLKQTFNFHNNQKMWKYQNF